MSNSSPKTLLIAIVDDDPVVREALEMFIESMDHNAAVFASAEEYLRSGLIRNTSCLISDMQMPGMSGLDLQQRLIADGNRVPIIFVTAECDHETCARGLKAGAIGFLTKPFEPRCLIACLNEALSSPCWTLQS
jgi:FixJ family two-component response regulator